MNPCTAQADYNGTLARSYLHSFRRRWLPRLLQNPWLHSSDCLVSHFDAVLKKTVCDCPDKRATVSGCPALEQAFCHMVIDITSPVYLMHRWTNSLTPSWPIEAWRARITTLIVSVTSELLGLALEKSSSSKVHGVRGDQARNRANSIQGDLTAGKLSR
jgi:hypothetical protein